MNFLVTGGAGFIGSHVCERLLDLGHAVWTFDDLNPFYDPAIKQRGLQTLKSLRKPFTFVRGDLTERTALDALFGSVKFDQVIHLAAREDLSATATLHREKVRDIDAASGQLRLKTEWELAGHSAHRAS